MPSAKSWCAQKPSEAQYSSLNTSASDMRGTRCQSSQVSAIELGAPLAKALAAPCSQASSLCSARRRFAMSSRSSPAISDSMVS